MIKIVFGLLLGLILTMGYAQNATIKGQIVAEGNTVAFANIYFKNTQIGTTSDENGRYMINEIPPGEYMLIASNIGFFPFKKKLSLSKNEELVINIVLEPNVESLEEMVVTGTLKPVNRLESPVPVEVYKPTFFKKNPTASIFEALQNVNGVRPQINCNVCNTGDIHINGLEGPYTLVLIDGMPIVSGLGTVYGLSGIPNSLIEQVEIIKGPASTLYGSEAVGGLINIITKDNLSAPQLVVDSFITDWGEFNLDIGTKFNLGENANVLLGINYFKYDNPIDNNEDNFTDLTLQDRISIFQKWNFKRDNACVLSIAGRYFYEDRWGGELQWTPKFRGGDEIYGESIYTKRWEILGKYQLPVEEQLMLSFSYNDHSQNSVYGNVPYLADQRIGFTQLTWDKTFNTHNLLAGTALRYNYYDDNTTATMNLNGNLPNEVLIPSIFIQDEIAFNKKHALLGGLRYDFDKRHGSIFTPRGAYRYKFTDNDILRINAGTGFRVVNLFTEEHAALTGARDVIIAEELKPERSFNINLNYLKKIYSDNGTFAALDASIFYTNFKNAIIPDYDTDPNQIIYDNLRGKSVSKGLSTSLNISFHNGPKIMLGATFQDVSTTENGATTRQILTESFAANWGVSYTVNSWDMTIDYTGNLYGPMRLPTFGANDPRREYSPTWSIQNIQFSHKGLTNIEIYGGVKNILNWTPNKGNPFIIARANDPFDKEVTFDNNGNAVPTQNNPYGLTFDPSYVYAPNQGIRTFFGLRYTIN
ncbi:TonB-dependent receptor [Maribacter sp. MAR_2009_72]|uniref:TonB-dependent receptor n=1 Tax=Maribacter sp. MAR_2009_72 TaxID=1250050 RepID=UPI00119BF044|nr:TonB-dependent receptor [Maribacter sp. MAR_2009_72]TVZ16387.1 outer membrane receptor for ferrienterochelin and colicins [Maribacter sp. MAR_2009_72]